MQSQTERPFIIVMQATIGMVPMIKSWLCNTKTMVDVHKNTLIIVDALGFQAMEQFETEATIVMDALPPSLQGSWAYGTRGYWRTTQNRVEVIGHLLRAGIAILLVEPDQVLIRNVYEQDDLVGDMNADLVGSSDGRVRPEFVFGFLRIKPNDVVLGLWAYVEENVDRDMGGKISEMSATEDPNVGFHSVGEQFFFNQELWRLSQKGQLKANTLNTCRYPNGQWYDGGRGGDGKKIRSACARSQNQLVVIHNNWIVGNERKVLRAKRWDHWFLQQDESMCQIPEAIALQRAVDSTEHGRAPHGAPTRAEKE